MAQLEWHPAHRMPAKHPVQDSRANLAASQSPAFFPIPTTTHLGQLPVQLVPHAAHCTVHVTRGQLPQVLPQPGKWAPAGGQQGQGHLALEVPGGQKQAGTRVCIARAALHSTCVCETCHMCEAVYMCCGLVHYHGTHAM